MQSKETEHQPNLCLKWNFDFRIIKFQSITIRRNNFGVQLQSKLAIGKKNERENKADKLFTWVDCQDIFFWLL